MALPVPCKTCIMKICTKDQPSFKILPWNNIHKCSSKHKALIIIRVLQNRNVLKTVVLKQCLHCQMFLANTLKRVHRGHWDLKGRWCWLRRPALDGWNSSITLSHGFSGFLLFFSLFSQMDLHVATAFIRSCKSSTTCVTGKRFLTSVCTDVSCQMVWTGKVPHADPTLEWFLSSVGSHVACQFIRPWEPSWACINWACIRPLTWWCSWAPISRVVTLCFQYSRTSLGRATSLNRFWWRSKKVRRSCGVQKELVHHCRVIWRHCGRKWRRTTKYWPFHVQCGCSLHKHRWIRVHWLLNRSLVKVGLWVVCCWDCHLLLWKFLWSRSLYLVWCRTYFLGHWKLCVREKCAPRCSSSLTDQGSKNCAVRNPQIVSRRTVRRSVSARWWSRSSRSRNHIM